MNKAQSIPSSNTCVQCVLLRVNAGSRRHWLLHAVYGRDLLKLRLRQLRPDLHVPIWDDALELDPLLDHVIDDLGREHAALTLAKKCVEAWNDFLSDHGVHIK